MSTFTNEVLDVQKVLLRHPHNLTVNFLFRIIVQWYLRKSATKLQRSTIPIITKSLRRRLFITIRAVQSLTSEFPYILLKQLEFRILKLIQRINNQFNFKPKQAPIVSTEDAFRIANYLWKDESRTRGTRSSSIINRKKAATVTVLASLSGSRWIDLHRLHWEDIVIEKQPLATFMYVTLRMSKNNLCNEVPQRLFWSSASTTVVDRCPIFWLQRYWSLRGKPKKGFIFGPENCDTPDVSWGAHTIWQVQRAAKLLNFPVEKIPTRHSFRVTMAVTLYNLGVDSKRINRFLNWKTDKMQEHYINTRDSQALDAPAHRLAVLSSSELQNLQKQFL